MTQRSQRQCTVEEAKWKNALNMHDRMQDVVMTMPTDYTDCRLDENVLGVADRVVGNQCTGLITSQINQVNATIVVRDAIERAMK